jgi:hypothetical protein
MNWNLLGLDRPCTGLVICWGSCLFGYGSGSISCIGLLTKGSKFVNPEIDAAIASKEEIATMADVCIFDSLHQ